MRALWPHLPTLGMAVTSVMVLLIRCPLGPAGNAFSFNVKRLCDDFACCAAVAGAANNNFKED